MCLRGGLALRCGRGRLRRRRYYQDAPLGDPAARALAASPYLDNVRRLELVHFRDVADDTVAALRQRFGERIIL